MTLRRSFLLPLLLAVCAASHASLAQGAGGAASKDDSPPARILDAARTKLDEACAAANVPGATVGFAPTDGSYGSASTGFADLETRKRLT